MTYSYILSHWLYPQFPVMIGFQTAAFLVKVCISSCIPRHSPCLSSTFPSPRYTIYNHLPVVKGVCSNPSINQPTDGKRTSMSFFNWNLKKMLKPWKPRVFFFRCFLHLSNFSASVWAVLFQPSFWCKAAHTYTM